MNTEKSNILNYLSENPVIAVEILDELVLRKSEKIHKIVKNLKLTGKYLIDNGFWAVTNLWNDIAKVLPYNRQSPRR